MPTASSKAVLTGENLIALGQLAATAATAIATIVMVFLYKRIAAIMAETNAISSRSVDELTRARKQEYLPILAIRMYQVHDLGPIGRVRLQVLNVGKGPAFAARWLYPAIQKGRPLVGPVGTKTSEYEEEISVPRDAVEYLILLLAYVDAVGADWRVERVGDRLSTRQVGPEDPHARRASGLDLAPPD